MSLILHQSLFQPEQIPLWPFPVPFPVPETTYLNRRHKILLTTHYKLLGATGETLTTLGTVQVDILLGRKVWTTTAIVVSSLTHHLILGLNFLKLTKSKVDFETNTVETGSTLYLANIHCMQRSNSTIIIPKSDVYRLCQSLHPTLNVTSSLPLASKTSPLFNLNVTLLGKNYWPMAPQSA